MSSTSVFSQSQYFDGSNVRARSDNPKVRAKAEFKSYIRYCNKVHAFLIELSKRVHKLEVDHVIVMRRRSGPDGQPIQYEADSVGYHPSLLVQGPDGRLDIRPDQAQFYQEFITKVGKDKNGQKFTTLYTVNGNVLKSLNSEFREMLTKIILVQEEMERLSKRKKTSTTNSFSLVYHLSEHAMNFFKTMDYTVPHLQIGQKQVKVRRPNPPRMEDVMIGYEGNGTQDIRGRLSFLLGDAQDNAAYGMILSSVLTSLFTIHSYNMQLSNTREWLISQKMVQVDQVGRIMADSKTLQALLKGNHASDLMRQYFQLDMDRLTQETNGKFSSTSFVHAAFQTILKAHRTKVESTFKWLKEAGGDDRSHSKIAYKSDGTPEQHTFADWALTWPARKGADGRPSLDLLHLNVTLRLGQIGQQAVAAYIQQHEQAVAAFDQARAAGQVLEEVPALNRYIQKSIANLNESAYAQFIQGWNPGAYVYETSTIPALPDVHRHELSGDIVAVLYQDSAEIKEGCRHIRLYKKYLEEAAAKKLDAAKSAHLQRAVQEMQFYNGELNKYKAIRNQLNHAINETRVRHQALINLQSRSQAQEQERLQLEAIYAQSVEILAQVVVQLSAATAGYSVANQRKDRLQKAKTEADVAYLISA